jgi:site-specific DNA recombinase
VYQFNRIFRNSVDAGITKRDLKKYGTRVVPTIMDLGEGPEGDMVETILHAVGEYQSKANGADIAYKMGAKARNGGTLGRTRLGYVNARDLSEGRNIGIVKFDPERAPYMKMAFELYATDEYSIERLAQELNRRGLTTRRGRFPAGPISTSTLNQLLRDPYYIGYITYKGELIRGRHEPLISDDLFNRVQTVLDQHSGSGARQYRHHHYLKGSLWCGRCHEQGVESRMIMQWASGRGGRYLYFFCKEKQKHNCESRYVEANAVEDAVIDFYRTIRFPSDEAHQLRMLLHETLDDEEKASKLLHQQLTAALLRLDTQEENLIDLAADGNLSSNKAKQRLAEIRRQRDQISSQLDQTGERLALGVQLIENALILLDDPQGLYERMAPEQRRLLNQGIFEKLYVFEDKVTKAVFNPPFDELMQVRGVKAVNGGRRKESPAAETAGNSRGSHSGPLATALFGDGSTKRVMVELQGLEPWTFRMPCERSSQLSYSPESG